MAQKRELEDILREHQGEPRVATRSRIRARRESTMTQASELTQLSALSLDESRASLDGSQAAQDATSVPASTPLAFQVFTESPTVYPGLEPGSVGEAGEANDADAKSTPPAYTAGDDSGS